MHCTCMYLGRPEKCVRAFGAKVTGHLLLVTKLQFLKNRSLSKLLGCFWPLKTAFDMFWFPASFRRLCKCVYLGTHGQKHSEANVLKFKVFILLARRFYNIIKLILDSSWHKPQQSLVVSLLLVCQANLRIIVDFCSRAGQKVKLEEIFFFFVMV